MNTRSVLACALIPALLFASCAKKEPPPPPGPPVVKVAEVVVKEIPSILEAIGQTRGSQEVEIRARVEGYLATVDFAEGTLVKEGDKLFTIDPKPFEAALSQAIAQIDGAKARLAKANQDVDRLRPLVEKNAVPKQDLDNAMSAVQSAQAAVDSATAAADKVKLDLGYTTIHSPVSGLVGRTEVKPGNLVGKGESTLLAKVSVVDPIHLRVNLSEKDYLKLSRRRIEAGSPAMGEGGLSVELTLADGTTHAHKGKAVFADSQVDAATGTLMVELAFPNPDRLIRPGQYGRARATSAEPVRAVLVPQRAVIQLQGTFSVALLEAGDIVKMRSVKVGERVGSLWVVTEGLAEGDRIVVEGLQKVRDGAKVVPAVVRIEDLYPAGEEGRSGGK